MERERTVRATAIVGRDGRITIPNSIRRALGLRRGDRIGFEAHEGRLIGNVARRVDVMTFFRSLPGIGEHEVDLAAERAAFVQAAVKNERKLRDDP